MIGKFFVRVGTWLNVRFPEKVSADFVLGSIQSMDATLKLYGDHLSQLEASNAQNGELLLALGKKVEALTSENAALKAQSALRMRTGSFIPMPGR